MSTAQEEEDVEEGWKVLGIILSIIFTFIAIYVIHMVVKNNKIKAEEAARAAAIKAAREAMYSSNIVYE